MAAIQTWQIKSIYALAGGLGMVERASHEDALHLLVGGLTGKASVKELDSAEAGNVLAELHERMKLSNAPVPKATTKKEHSTTPGGVTADQQRKVWALMYSLRKFDLVPNPASLGTRLCGIIKRQFGVTGFEREPFCVLQFEQGRELIEILKQYTTTAELKYLHREPFSAKGVST